MAAALRRAGTDVCFSRLSTVRARLPRSRPTPCLKRRSRTRRAPRSQMNGLAGASCLARTATRARRLVFAPVGSKAHFG
eukprot:4215963-Alexandrium_andersonii.AAC.1